MRKIIFIANNNIGNGFSGGDRIFIELIKNWEGKADISLIGSEEAIRIAKYRGVEGIKIIQSDTKNKDSNLSLPGFAKHALKRTAKGIEAAKHETDLIAKADFIYSASDFYPDLITAFYIKRKNKRIKWIAGYYLFAPKPWAEDSPYKGHNRLKGFFYWLMQIPSYFIAKRFADYVFVTSEPDVEKFITKKRDRTKIVVVQGGVDILESSNYLKLGKVVPMKDRKYDACFVGRLHYQKGVLELIDIWNEVVKKKPGARLAMIGDGPLENEIKNKIEDYSLKNNITLLGFLDGDKKHEIFKQSKIMVHPATYDSGGMAAAEGMAWGLPGISFDLEALKTYYPKGMIKTKCGNNSQFAENVMKLIGDETLYDRLSKEARNLIVDVWDWRKRAEKIYNLTFE